MLLLIIIRAGQHLKYVAFIAMTRTNRALIVLGLSLLLFDSSHKKPYFIISAFT